MHSTDYSYTSVVFVFLSALQYVVCTSGFVNGVVVSDNVPSGGVTLPQHHRCIVLHARWHLCCAILVASCFKWRGGGAKTRLALHCKGNCGRKMPRIIALFEIAILNHFLWKRLELSTQNSVDVAVVRHSLTLRSKRQRSRSHAYEVCCQWGCGCRYDCLGFSVKKS